jgi:hypothetical protein
VKHLLLIASLILLLLGFGLWLGSRVRPPTAYELERQALGLEFARRLLPFRVAFLALLGGVVLLTVGGLGWGVVRWLHRRAGTLYPDASGLYPLREGRVGRSRVFHDPNRALSGSTVYAPGQGQVIVRHVVPDGLEGAQQQVTGQAQAVQALRAAVSGPSPLPSSRQLPLDLLVQRRVSQPLPEVRELPYQPAHIERLLLEDGELVT